MKRSICLLLAAWAFAAAAQAAGPFSGLPLEELEEGDVELMRAALLKAVESPDGAPTKWLNPETGNRGEVTPLKTAQRDGRSCRLLEIRTETERGRRNSLRYAVCEQPDGSWKVE